MNSNHEGRFTTVLESLNVLGRLTENKKLKIHNGLIDIDNRGFQGFLRLYSKDKRDKCHILVNQLFDESISMAKSFLQEIINDSPKGNIDDYVLKREKALRQFGRINQTLEMALNGYQTQLTTYKDDDKHSSKVQVLIEQIREEMTDMALHLSSHERNRQQQQQQQLQNKDSKPVFQQTIPALAPMLVPVNTKKEKEKSEEDEVFDPFN